MNREITRGKRFLFLVRWVLGGIGLFFLSGCGFVQKASWIPPSPLNEVSIRQIPACNVIEAEVKGTINKSWQRGFRQDARYLSTFLSPLQYPVIINVPDWEEHDPNPEGVFYVELILKEEQNYETPREKGLSVVSFGAKTMACYAWEGEYTYENFLIALNKVRAVLKQRSIPSSGPPRVLLYRNPDWTMTRLCVGEVQIPVPDKITPD